MNTAAAETVTITTIYDNYVFKRGLVAAWGFSCLVQINGKIILFDAGGDGETLLGNMERLKIDLQKIEIMVLSHVHGDHTGGLFSLLERNSHLAVYVPESFTQIFKNKIKRYGAEVVDVRDPIQIHRGVYSTGEMGSRLREQSLIVETDDGLVVIVGCAHSGVIDIVKKSKKIGKCNVFMVMGGFHLLNHSSYHVNEIVNRLKEVGVAKVAPSHCTGLESIAIFKSNFGEDFIENGVGTVIAFGREAVEAQENDEGMR